MFRLNETVSWGERDVRPQEEKQNEGLFTQMLSWLTPIVPNERPMMPNQWRDVSKWAGYKTFHQRLLVNLNALHVQ